MTILSSGLFCALIRHINHEHSGLGWPGVESHCAWHFHAFFNEHNVVAIFVLCADKCLLSISDETLFQDFYTHNSGEIMCQPVSSVKNYRL